jgi:hypothetical protein
LNDSSANEKSGNKMTNSASLKDSTAKDGGKESKKDKKSKKKKEESNGMPAIKKPLSAYMLFNNYRRPTL